MFRWSEETSPGNKTRTRHLWEPEQPVQEWTIRSSDGTIDQSQQLSQIDPIDWSIGEQLLETIVESDHQWQDQDPVEHIGLGEQHCRGWKGFGL